ncbi:hypothetical protein GCM10010232_26810 [Streptomyces amakusaensis]|uniref:Integrin alpha n=1 Tax=Streptomyces amakusaensis TaxID=67271 RepID=A0ABW0AGQ8_9ACTN
MNTPSTHRRGAARALGLLAAIAVLGPLAAPAAFAAAPAAQANAQAAPAAPAAPAKKPKGKAQDDFNGDGYQDLAVGSPFATVGGKRPAGHVSVVYGSKSGLNISGTSGTPGKQVLHRGSKGIPGTPADFDYFRFGLGSADFDQDGYRTWW